MEKMLDEVDWALSKLKSLPVTTSGTLYIYFYICYVKGVRHYLLSQARNNVIFLFSLERAEEENNDQENIQINISQTLIGIVLSLHELIQSAFPQGVSGDTVTKVSTSDFTAYRL